MTRTHEDSAVGPGGTRLWSGNEAVPHAALAAGAALGTGYPGAPSTEILETFSQAGGRAQWSPNEQVALEVAVGVAFAGARALVTMKHVGVNVAADPLFTVAQTGLDGALVVGVCDDPGMRSSQNEQDSRRYAVAAMLSVLDAAGMNMDDLYAFPERRRDCALVVMRVGSPADAIGGLPNSGYAVASAEEVVRDAGQDPGSRACR